jgi:hypothetical protein
LRGRRWASMSVGRRGRGPPVQCVIDARLIWLGRFFFYTMDTEQSSNQR